MRRQSETLPLFQHPDKSPEAGRAAAASCSGGGCSNVARGETALIGRRWQTILTRIRAERSHDAKHFDETSRGWRSRKASARSIFILSILGVR